MPSRSLDRNQSRLSRIRSWDPIALLDLIIALGLILLSQSPSLPVSLQATPVWCLWCDGAMVNELALMASWARFWFFGPAILISRPGNSASSGVAQCLLSSPTRWHDDTMIRWYVDTYHKPPNLPRKLRQEWYIWWVESVTRYGTVSGG